SVLTLRMRSGAVATIYSACCADGGGGGVLLNVYARQHTVQFSGWNHTAKILTAEGEPREIEGEPAIFQIEDTAFLNAVRTGDRSSILCDYPDGFRTAEVTLAGNRSMETGKPVEIAERKA